MAEDDRLLELLGRALSGGEVEPPADRVAALRIQAAARQERGSPAATPSPPPADAGVTPPPPPPPLPPPAPIPLHRPAPAPVPTALRTRRVGWLAAGVGVAAVAVVVALVAAPALLGDRGDERSVASGSVSNTRDAVSRLRAALVSRDPLTVARADAELVLLARQLPPAERAAVEAEVVQAHVEAIQFLREHVPTAPGAAKLPPTTVPHAAAPLPASGPTDDPAGPTTTMATPVPTTTAAPARSVTITAVTPAADGTFAVEFSVSGFTPARRPGAGSYAVLFSFDGGQERQVWDGPSPWTFPTDMAIRYERVCAVVVDADGIEQPGSGNCVAIL